MLGKSLRPGLKKCDLVTQRRLASRRQWKETSRSDDHRLFKQLNHQVSAMLNWIETPAGPLPPPAAAVTLRRRIPHALLRHDVVEISAYQEGGMESFRQVQPARLEIPWIISFGEPFFVKMGKEIQACATSGSFVVGLVAGPAVIESRGRSSCITVSFTPAGAHRFFALPLHEIAGCMVTQEDLLGSTGAALREQLNAEAGWERRFDMVEYFLAMRLHRTVGEMPQRRGPLSDCGNRKVREKSRPLPARSAGAESISPPNSAMR